MILKGENFEKFYNSEDVQSHLKKYGCYFLDLIKIDNDKILVYDKEEFIDEIKVRTKELDELFERRDIFKLSLKKEGYYVIRYCDIHKHSLYSILDGMSTIPEIVKHTEYSGALTDHGNMYGFFKFYNAMKKAGKKPIIGFEAYVKGYFSDKGRNHLVVLVKNNEGFKNAIKLCTLGYVQGHKTKKTVKPSFDYEELFKHKEGLIVTSACLGGDIQKNIAKDEIEKAYAIAKRFKEEFGEDFYIEIQRHGIEVENKVNMYLLKIAKDLDIKVIAGVDAHYAKKEDRVSQERLLALNTGTTMSNPKRYSFDGDGYHIHTSDEMVELFYDIPEALDNTLEIADKIEFQIETGKYFLPEFDIPQEHKLYDNPQNETEIKANEYNYFEYLCKKGLKDRGLEGDKEAEERLDFEMGVIKKMGYASYFLIVWDFINFAKSNGILVGPGRGSACGSLASYCLLITDVNPLEYGLLFERFLSPDRISMPDIDVDFQDDRREEVIAYVKSKYGEDCVSNIITFGNMKSKSAVKDMARVLDYPHQLGDKISKLIPDKVKNLNDALNSSIELKELYDIDKDVKKIIDGAIKVEGLPKSTGKHACGVLISPRPVTEFIPQVIVMDKKDEKNDKGEIEYEEVMVTQVDMTECEELGLLKMDFLGLKTLTIISRALELANKRRVSLGLPEIDTKDIPLNDPYAYQHIQEGNTLGVFQLESPGMTDLVSKTYSDISNFIDKFEKNKQYTDKGMGIFSKDFSALFERLIALISLYRPGPMDEIPNYLHQMNNPQDIEYDTEESKEILKETFGIIVYQEQVMHMVREMAGFSKGQSDVIRKAMGKKKKEIVDEYGEYFIYGSSRVDKELIKEGKEPHNIEGCVPRGQINEEQAKTLWDKMYKFSAYAFNKSHATGYAVLAIQTAWLSKYYPVEFMTALLNCNINKNDKLEHYISKLKNSGFKLLGPCVNKSDIVFSIDYNQNAIRFGLKGIKGLGSSSSLVINSRNGQDFVSITDFVTRLNSYFKCDKSLLESIAKCGAFEDIELNRRSIVESAEIIADSLKKDKKKNVEGQISLLEAFSDMEDSLANIATITLKDVPDYTKDEKLAFEKDLLSFYVSGHPLDKYEKIIKNSTELTSISDIKAIFCGFEDEDEYSIDELGFVDEEVNNQFTIIGQIVEEKVIQTRKGDLMSKIVIEDISGEISCTLFPKTREAYRSRLAKGNVVVVTGRAENSDFGLQMIVEDVSSPQTLSTNQNPYAIKVLCPFSKTGVERPRAVSMYNDLRNIVNSLKGRGKEELEIIFVVEDQEISLGEIPANINTFMSLKNAFGEDKLEYEY